MVVSRTQAQHSGVTENFIGIVKIIYKTNENYGLIPNIFIIHNNFILHSSAESYSTVSVQTFDWLVLTPSQWKFCMLSL